MAGERGVGLGVRKFVPQGRKAARLKSTGLPDLSIIFTSRQLCAAVAKWCTHHGLLGASMKRKAQPQIALYSTDTFGSVIHLHLNDVSHHLSYLPFGFTAFEGDIRPLLGHKGLYIEPRGKYLRGNGYRLLDTSLMRNCSEDSLSSFSLAGINYYADSLNDPINNYDPSGHMPFSSKSKLTRRIEKLNKNSTPLQKVTDNLLSVHQSRDGSRWIADNLSEYKSEVANFSKLYSATQKTLTKITASGGAAPKNLTPLYERANTVLEYLQRSSLQNPRQQSAPSQSNFSAKEETDANYYPTPASSAVSPQRYSGHIRNADSGRQQQGGRRHWEME